MDKVLIWGKGGHSSVVAEQMLPELHYQFIDDTDFIYKSGKLLDIYPISEYKIFVAIGDNYIRQRVYERLQQYGYSFISILSPFTYISKNTIIENNVFVAPGCVVQPNVSLKRGCIINTGATVDHDCEIGEFVHIAPGSHLCGGVNIGARTLVGVGTSIIPNKKIVNDCIIAGGSSVNRDLLEDYSLYAGTPVILKKKLKNADS